jgi:hypothetical protein
VALLPRDAILRLVIVVQEAKGGELLWLADARRAARRRCALAAAITRRTAAVASVSPRRQAALAPLPRRTAVVVPIIMTAAVFTPGVAAGVGVLAAALVTTLVTVPTTVLSTPRSALVLGVIIAVMPPAALVIWPLAAPVTAIVFAVLVITIIQRPTRVARHGETHTRVRRCACGGGPVSVHTLTRM